MNLREAIRAALAELGRHATADEVREWCRRRGVASPASFDKLVENEKARMRASLLQESHEKLTEELQKLNAEVEERVRVRASQLRELVGRESFVPATALTPTAFREATNRRAAVALLPVRVQVLLAAEWARSVLPVLLGADPNYFRPQHALDAVTRWALAPTEANAAEVATFTARDRDGPMYLFGTAPLRAAGAVDAAVRAATEAIDLTGCAATVAECGRLVVSGSSAPGYAALNAGWLRLFTTCRHALGPGVPFDPAWRTSTAVTLAQGIVRDRALDRMPILADALRDAGCLEEALGHMQDAWTLADWSLWNLLGLDAAPPARVRGAEEV